MMLTLCGWNWFCDPVPHAVRRGRLDRDALSRFRDPSSPSWRPTPSHRAPRGFCEFDPYKKGRARSASSCRSRYAPGMPMLRMQSRGMRAAKGILSLLDETGGQGSERGRAVTTSGALAEARQYRCSSSASRFEHSAVPAVYLRLDERRRSPHFARCRLVAMIARAHQASAYGESSVARKTLAAQSKLPKIIAENLGAGFGQWEFFPEASEIVDFAFAYVPPSTEDEVWALARSWASDDAAGRHTLMAGARRSGNSASRAPPDRDPRSSASSSKRLSRPARSRFERASGSTSRRRPQLIGRRRSPRRSRNRRPRPAPTRPIPTQMPKPEFKKPVKAGPAPPPKRFTHPKFGEGMLEAQDGTGDDAKLTINSRLARRPCSRVTSPRFPSVPSHAGGRMEDERPDRSGSGHGRPSTRDTRRPTIRLGAATTRGSRRATSARRHRIPRRDRASRRSLWRSRAGPRRCTRRAPRVTSRSGRSSATTKSQRAFFAAATSRAVPSSSFADSSGSRPVMKRDGIPRRSGDISRAPRGTVSVAFAFSPRDPSRAA